MISRRTFVEGLAVGVAGAAVSASAKSYGQIVGANDRLNFAIFGLNGRGYAHLSALKSNAKMARVSHVCDVDRTILGKFAGVAGRELGYAPAAEGDCRRVLEAKDVDVITIATPDHWHAPMAILGLKAGKHVYVEKPSSHNPREGELLVAAQAKYGRLVQVGDQQRSSPHTIKIVGEIHEGRIGRAYAARAWYVNTRLSMGVGRGVAVPAGLDWDLWQGPAPRGEYKDNIQPYNWHWLRRYGTGEALNNGTHEVDVCRWALGAGMPGRVTAMGGRYQYVDDWQFPDTMVTSFTYPDQMLTWDGRSCQGMREYGRERGCLILGTKGSVVLDRDGYEVYDWKGKQVDEFKTGKETSTSDLLGVDSMTDLHFGNLIAAIRTGVPLHSPVAVANVSVTMLQLSNIAWMVGRELGVDPATGHVVGDAEAMGMWGRTYEPGWEPRV